MKKYWSWVLLGTLNGVVGAMLLDGVWLFVFVIALPLIFNPLYYWMKRS